MNKVFGVLSLLLVVFVFSQTEVCGQANSTASCKNTTEDFFLDYENYLRCYYPNFTKDKDYPKRLKKFIACYEKLLAKLNQTGGDKFRVALNRFCHWTDEEVNSSLNPSIPQRETEPNQTMSTFNLRDARAPLNFDWRSKNAVTSVKDQGQCGNCYTFAAVGAVEGQVAIKSGKLVDLSTQQYTSCSAGFGAGTSTYWSCTYSSTGTKNCSTWQQESWQKTNGQNNGCNGGAYTACWAYNNLTSSSMNSEICYPATSASTLQKGTCSYKSSCSSTPTISVTNYVLLPANDENALLQAVATVGPVACAIYVDDNFQSYDQGIFNGTRKSTNHAILVVGYGTENGTDYWTIKNSWSSDWGENGYIRLVRGCNAINIANYCAYPLVTVKTN